MNRVSTGQTKNPRGNMDASGVFMIQTSSLSEKNKKFSSQVKSFVYFCTEKPNRYKKYKWNRV